MYHSNEACVGYACFVLKTFVDLEILFALSNKFVQLLMTFSSVFVKGFAFKIGEFRCLLMIRLGFGLTVVTKFLLSSFFLIINFLLNGLSVCNTNRNSKIEVISYTLSSIVSSSVIASMQVCTLSRRLRVGWLQLQV